ncbi:MAG: hypothetical protein IPM50_03365 [Acidobacteriota bacterium]|nr:MAG: hypothetical protein IPM50_03365 [Acidobacteriota bacterium]
MRGVLFQSPIALLLLAFALFGCSAKQEGPANSPASPQTDQSAAQGVPSDRLEDLKLLVRVPFEAEDGVWRIDPRSKKLTAVLIFTPEDARLLLDELRKGGEGNDAEIALESWFPEELIAKGEMSGDAELRGKSYPADVFLMESYKSGRVIHIEETEIFILELRSGE